MHLIRKVTKLFFLTLSLTIIALASQAQQFQNDGRLLDDYQKAIDSLLLKTKTVTMQEAQEQLAGPGKIVNVDLAKTSSKVLKANALYERAKLATVITGCAYLCPRCSQVHLSEASGYIIDPKGIMVTNYHVAATYAEMKDGYKPLGLVVRLSNGRTYAVSAILASSKNDDLAILQLETNGDVLTVLPLAKGAKVGDQVSVLGHPKGMHYFFSQGIVNDRYLEEAGEPGHKIFREMMPISADYATGSSGGPVLDVYGNVVATVSNTTMLIHSEMNPHVQMVRKNTVPVESLWKLIGKGK